MTFVPSKIILAYLEYNERAKNVKQVIITGKLFVETVNTGYKNAS